MHLIASMILCELFSVSFKPAIEAIKWVISTFINVMTEHLGFDYSKFLAFFASTTLFLMSLELIIVQDFFASKRLKAAFKLYCLQ